MRIVRRLMIVIGCVGLLGVACIVYFPSVQFVIAMGLIGFADPSWRRIADTNGLVADCRVLIADVPIDSVEKEYYARAGYVRIPHERWSSRIREVWPTQVRVDRESCHLLYHNQFQNLTWGYSLYPAADARIPRPCDRPRSCGDRYVWPTGDHRIVRWESTSG